MTGHHVADRALAYWSHELAESDRALVEEHLRSCAACRRELDAVRVALDAVSVWPKDPALPPAVERRVLERVRPNVASQLDAHVERPIVARPTRPRWSSGRVAATIAAVACGAVGFALGRATTSATAGASATAVPPNPAMSASVEDSTLRPFLLLLEERSWPPPRPLARPGYREWSRAIVSQARFVGAQKLTDESGFRLESDGRAVRPEASERPPNVSGWYIVRARNYDEAIDWARRGPHLAYGSVLVRQIEEPRRPPR